MGVHVRVGKWVGCHAAMSQHIVRGVCAQNYSTICNPWGFRLWPQLVHCANLLYVSEYFVFGSEAWNWEQKLI